jgi:hypothetical protein
MALLDNEGFLGRRANIFIRVQFRKCIKAKKSNFLSNFRDLIFLMISYPDLPYFLVFRSLILTLRNIEFTKIKFRKVYFTLLAILYALKNLHCQTKGNTLIDFYASFISISKSKKYSKFDPLIFSLLDDKILPKIPREICNRIFDPNFLKNILENQISQDLINSCFSQNISDSHFLLIQILNITKDPSFIENILSFFTENNCLGLLHFGLKILIKRKIALVSIITSKIDEYLTQNLNKMTLFQKFYINYFFYDINSLKAAIYYSFFNSDRRICKLVAVEIIRLLDSTELEAFLEELKTARPRSIPTNFIFCLFSLVEKDAKKVLYYFKESLFNYETLSVDKIIDYYLIQNHCKFADENVSFDYCMSFLVELLVFLFPNIKKGFLKRLDHKGFVKCIIIMASQKDNLLQKMAYIYLNFISSYIDSNSFKLFFRYVNKPKEFPCILKNSLPVDNAMNLPNNGSFDLDDDAMLELDKFFSKMFSSKGNNLHQIFERIYKCILLIIEAQNSFRMELIITFVKCGLNVGKIDKLKILKLVVDLINQGHDCSKIVPLFRSKDMLRDIIVSTKDNQFIFNYLVQELITCLKTHKSSYFLKEILESSHNRNSTTFFSFFENNDFKNAFLSFLTCAKPALGKPIFLILEKYLLQAFQSKKIPSEKICRLFGDILLKVSNYSFSENAIEKLIGSLDPKSKEFAYWLCFEGINKNTS